MKRSKVLPTKIFSKQKFQIFNINIIEKVHIL